LGFSFRLEKKEGAYHLPDEQAPPTRRRAMTITLVEVEDRPRAKSVKVTEQPTWGYSFSPKAFSNLRREIKPLDIVRLKPLKEKLTQGIDSTVKSKCPQVPEEARGDTVRQIINEALGYAPKEFGRKFANWAVDRAETLTLEALEQLKLMGIYTFVKDSKERKERTGEDNIYESVVELPLKAAKKEDKQGKQEPKSPDVIDLTDLGVTPPGKPKKLSAYLIRKELLARDRVYDGWHCGLCHKRRNPRELKAIRVTKNKDNHSVSDYVLMCGICREERAQRKKVRPLYGGSFELKDEQKLSKSAFCGRIRAKVLERDHHKCCYCGEKPNGLAPIRPLSKGGELSIDNYVAACQKCRCSKGNDLPLDFFIRRDEYWEQAYEDQDRGTIKVGIGMATIDPYYVAETMQFLAKLVSNKDLEREVRNKAERLVIKLGETDQDRSREAKQELRPLF